MACLVETIQSENLIFRGINETDTEKIVLWRSNPEVYKFFKSPHKLTVDEHLNWYNNSYLQNNHRYDWICIERESGEKIGVFGLVNENGYAEINYLLAPDAQHKGFAKEGITRLILYAFDTLKVNRVIAEIHKDNIPSITVIKKLGFKLVSDVENFVIYEIEG